MTLYEAMKTVLMGNREVIFTSNRQTGAVTITVTGVHETPVRKVTSSHRFTIEDMNLEFNEVNLAEIVKLLAERIN